MEKNLVIFDLNGIFIESPYLSDRFQESFGIVSELFLPVLNEVMSVVRKPNSIKIYDLFEPYLKNWDINLNEKQFLNFWFSAEKLNFEMFELLKELKTNRIKLVLISNNFKERTNYYLENFPVLFQQFDEIYFSWITNNVKPSEKAYNQILNDFKLNPKNCIYFDDSKKNIEIANSLGIDSYIFQGKEQVINLLK